MKNIDLVTEGILTLGNVTKKLENRDINNPKKDGASQLIKLIMQCDEITLLVGTKINNAHQDPNLPIELEIRRNVIKRISALLEEKYLKRVKIEYI